MSKNLNTNSNRKSNIFNYLIEAVLIFTSVFLAFWLTEYRESNEKEEILEISLQYIASEMEYNHNRIESTFSYYLDIISQIDSIKNISEKNLSKMYGYQLKDWHGMQLPMLRSTSYKTFLSTGISNQAPFELSKALADIYNLQSVIERIDNSFYDLAASDYSFTALPKVRHLMGIYIEIMPDVILFYQKAGKEWLEKYGYNLKIYNSKLINEIKKLGN